MNFVNAAIAAIDWAEVHFASHRQDGGGPAAAFLDEAVEGLIAANITTVVPAGRLGVDIDEISPGRISLVIAVGAINKSDCVTSNPDAHIYAPGAQSPWQS